MKLLTDTIQIKRWQAWVLVGMTGFAVGNILAKTTAALGF